MSPNAIFGVAVVGFPSPPLSPTARNARSVLPCKSDLGRSAVSPRGVKPAGRQALRPSSPHQEGTTVAKNRNQNPNRRAEQQVPQRGPAMDAQEQGSGHHAEEHMMPASTQAPRKQSKRFGHN
jgi:hypothetical protein